MSRITNQKAHTLRLIGANSLIPSIFFTLTLDFIFALPLTKDRYNALMSMTCKFSKRITLIKGKDIWTAKERAYAFLTRFNLVD